MHCPFCKNEDTQVIDTRVLEDGLAIRRRRRCLACDQRFTTRERLERVQPLVIKKNGMRVEYDRNKLLASMQLAVRKRPISAELLDAALDRIEEHLFGAATREIAAQAIGEAVINELKQLDKVAYIRFASVYYSFEDLEQFEQAIAEVVPRLSNEQEQQ